ncbi:MAG: hypothetical protein ACI9EF_003099 [Pseudohongiellaceae bacterium]|jgi:uncharacterized protein (TIGR00730 family)
MTQFPNTRTHRLRKPGAWNYALSDDFKAPESWRLFRIMGEFVEATEELETVRPAVAVYGSARTRPEHRFYERAQELSRKLSHAGFGVVTGGGPGIMEAANRGAQEGPSVSVGLNIELPHEQGGNAFQDISLQFRYFFVRKVMFVKSSCAFCIFPGGFGTLDELFEAMTLIQTGKIARFPILLMDVDYFTPLVDLLRNQLLGEGMISEKDLDLLHITNDVDEAVERIQAAWESKSFSQEAPATPTGNPVPRSTG